jgi:leucine dehydrogenase
LGATVNDDTLQRLKCDIIAGAANNQLKDETVHADACKKRNIIYAPDFLINSGGIINVYYEVIKNYNRDRVFAHTEKIYDITSDLLRKSEEENINTHEAAVRIALKRIEDVGRLKMTF